MLPYKALIFDLCDTLMPYCDHRMPEVLIRGQTIHTSTPLLFDCFNGYSTNVLYEQFYDHFVTAKEAVVALRQSGKEVSMAERFHRFLDRLHVVCDQREKMQDQFLQIHRNQVALCLHCPNENRALLETLYGKYRVGLITNFDDTETVYHVLDREGVRGLFHTILISAEFGLRKPRREIFLAACTNLGVSPTQTLFIGDSLKSDIAGAQGVGMDTVWVNPDREALPKEAPRPNYVVEAVAELTSILERETGQI